MLLLLCPAVDAEELTLHDALLRAMGANLEMREERLSARGAELLVSQARAAFQPTFEAGASLASGGDVSVAASLAQSLPSGGSLSASWGGGDAFGLSLSQPLLDGAGSWTALAGIRSARRSRDAEILALRARAESLALSVSGAYWGLAASRENLDLARRSLQIAGQQLADTRERKDQGFAALGDVLQVERAVGVARQAVVVAEAEVESAQAALSRLMGVRLEDRTPLEPSDQPQVPDAALDLPSAIDRARLFNASFLRQRLVLDAAQDALRLARHAVLPSLDASLLLTSPQASTSAAGLPSWNVGLSFSTPLFGRADRRAAERAGLQADAARLALDAADQDLVLAVEAAVRELRRDRARLDLARQTVEVAQAALKADQELLNAGRGSSREVVRSLEALDAANVSRLQAEIDLQASHLALLQVEGLLLESLGLATP